MRLSSWLRATSLIWKAAIASAAAWEIAKWTDSTHPYLAPLSVLLCLQGTVDQSLKFAWVRIFGTVVGVLLTVLIALYLEVHGWSIALVVLASAGIFRMLGGSDQMLHQAMLSAVLVLVFEHRSHDYALDRIKDTIIGAATALLLHLFLYPPTHTRTAAESVQRYATLLADRYHEAALWVERGCLDDPGHLMHRDICDLLKELHQTEHELQKSSDSCRALPFRTRERTYLDSLQMKVQPLQQGYVHLAEMVRSLTAWAKSGTMTTADQAKWAAEMRRLAEIIENWQNGSAVETRPPTLPPELEPHRQQVVLSHQAAEIWRVFAKKSP